MFEYWRVRCNALRFMNCVSGREGYVGRAFPFALEFELHATDATKHLGPEYHNLFVKPLG